MIDSLLVAQIALVGCLTVWMIVAVSSNWFRPRLNLEAVSLVARMDVLRDRFPAEFEAVGHRRIENPAILKTLFRLMVAAETIACIMLVVGTACLILAAFGIVDAGLAQLLALIGTLCFTAVWTAFLTGGDYFCYWYCHFDAQSTHLMLTIWGTLVTVVLLLPG